MERANGRRSGWLTVGSSVGRLIAKRVAELPLAGKDTDFRGCVHLCYSKLTVIAVGVHHTVRSIVWVELILFPASGHAVLVVV